MVIGVRVAVGWVVRGWILIGRITGVGIIGRGVTGVRIIVRGVICRRWNINIRGQVNHLTGEDQTCVPNLGVDSKHIAQENSVLNRNIAKGISPPYNIGAANLGWIISRGRGVVSRWDIKYLTRVQPPAKSGIGSLDSLDSGAAGRRNTVQRITPLDSHVVGAA